MAHNRVQFECGLGVTEFNVRYGAMEQRHAPLVRMRWPEGYVCPGC